MKDVALGRYWPVDSFWHRRHPAAKLCVLAAMIGPSIVAGDLLSLVPAAFTAAILWVGARLPVRFLLRAVRAFSWLIWLTLIGTFFLAPGGIGRSGWALAGLNALKLIVLFTLGQWLTATTPPWRLVAVFVRSLRPLKVMGVHPGDLGLVAGLGLRLLPEMLAVGERLHMAQSARGVGRERGWRSWWRRTESYLTALFVQAFRRADELAMALAARGYRPGRGGTLFPALPFGPVDAVVIVVAVLWAAALLWW